MVQSSKIVFFGNERLSSGFQPTGAPVLEALIKRGYDVRAVVSNFEHGTSRKARKLEISEVTKANSIPLLLPHKLSEIKDELASFNAKIGVLVAYGKIIPQSIIDLFPYGIVNIHPSLLPIHRGPTPIEQAILDGSKETGVSLMKLVKEMDAGPIYAQRRVILSGAETKQGLTQNLLELGRDMLIEKLPHILANSAPTTQQDDAKATYTQLLSKESGRINTTKTAEELEREIRAYAEWPKSSLILFEKYKIIVTKVRVAASPQDGTLILACGNNSFLEIVELVAPSGRKMSGEDFMRGYRP